MKMSRRGFLQLLGGTAAAGLSVGVIRRVPGKWWKFWERWMPIPEGAFLYDLIASFDEPQDGVATMRLVADDGYVHLNISFHRRATYRWVAAPGFEFMSGPGRTALHIEGTPGMTVTGFYRHRGKPCMFRSRTRG